VGTVNRAILRREAMMGWSAALLAMTMMTGAGALDDSIEVVVRGTLRTGIMAVGGETTGTTITARGVTWELDLRGRPEWTARAESLAGRRVIVTGTLEVRPGVERRQRSIVTVKSLEPLGPVPATTPRR
jgi:hypothetical protein